MSKKPRTQIEGWPDVHPRSSTSGWDRRGKYNEETFSLAEVAPLVGLQPAFIRRALDKKKELNFQDIEKLLFLDDATETFVPRSKVISYFEKLASRRLINELKPQNLSIGRVICGDAHRPEA